MMQNSHHYATEIIYWDQKSGAARLFFQIKNSVRADRKNCPVRSRLEINGPRRPLIPLKPNIFVIIIVLLNFLSALF